ICRGLSADLPAIRAGAPHAQGDLAAATERALLLCAHGLPAAPHPRALSSIGTTLPTTTDADAEAQGALAALLLGRLRERLVAFWLALGGPAFAIACAMFERRSIATHARKGSGAS